MFGLLFPFSDGWMVLLLPPSPHVALLDGVHAAAAGARPRLREPSAVGQRADHPKLVGRVLVPYDVVPAFKNGVEFHQT